MLLNLGLCKMSQNSQSARQRVDNGLSQELSLVSEGQETGSGLVEDKLREMAPYLLKGGAILVPSRIITYLNIKVRLAGTTSS